MESKQDELTYFLKMTEFLDYKLFRYLNYINVNQINLLNDSRFVISQITIKFDNGCPLALLILNHPILNNAPFGICDQNISALKWHNISYSNLINI